MGLLELPRGMSRGGAGRWLLLGAATVPGHRGALRAAHTSTPGADAATDAARGGRPHRRCHASLARRAGRRVWGECGSRRRVGTVAHDRRSGALSPSTGAVRRVRGRDPEDRCVRTWHSPRRPIPGRSRAPCVAPGRRGHRTGRGRRAQLEQDGGDRSGSRRAWQPRRRSPAALGRVDGGAGRRAERALAAAHAHMHAGAFDAAWWLVGRGGGGGRVDDLQRARIEQLRGQIEYASNPGPEAPVRLLRAARRPRCGSPLATRAC